MLLVLSLVPALENMPTIQSLKKAELIEAIRALGEEPPAKWGVTELRVMLSQKAALTILPNEKKKGRVLNLRKRTHRDTHKQRRPKTTGNS